jgi:hypothetical protein
MSSQTLRAFALATVASVLSAGAAWSQSASTPPGSTLTITLDATAGPILAGTDPGGLDGKAATATLMLSQSVSPVKHTSNSATYKVPAGAVTLVAGGKTFTNTSPGKMTIKLAGANDILTITYASTFDGLPVTVVDTSYLAKHSWTATVLVHPRRFTPSPQDLTAAATASGPGSKLKYTALGTTTVLGITGTATSGSAADPILPDDDDSE